MGSGVLLAILVALWFIVLVPMVVTRGDLATTPAEPVRVLRRRSDRSAMPSSAKSPDDQPVGGPAAARTADVEDMLTEPIPELPRRIPGATLPVSVTVTKDRPPVSERPATRVVAEQPVADSPGPERNIRAEIGIRTRRRRLLTGLVALAGLWALFAVFWQPVLWWPQIVLDLGIFSYLVFLRLEAQREQDRQERRRARAATRVKMPEDRTQRLVRRHTQYQAHVTAATEHQAIALDDEDPSFAEMPTWDATRASDLGTDVSDWTQRKAV